MAFLYCFIYVYIHLHSFSHVVKYALHAFIGVNYNVIRVLEHIYIYVYELN